jgi:hypothetical protein
MHTTNDGIDILAALDKGTGATTMRIDSDGAVRAPEVIYGASNKSLVQLDATMVAATSTDIGTDNLVMRDQALGTEIDNLHVVADSSNYTATFPPAGLYFTEGTCRGELTLLEDTRIRFQPYDVDGTEIEERTFSFGRAVPDIGAGENDVTADARRDGMLIEDDYLDQRCEIMCSNELPTIRLRGVKKTVTVGGQTQPMCPVFDVQDAVGDTQYAIFDDGSIFQKGHEDVNTSNLSSAHFNSAVHADSSVYIGSVRISYDRAVKALKFTTLKEAVPVYLAGKGITGPPTGHTLASMTVHGWVAYARTSQSNSRLEVHDVFPTANADWDDAGLKPRILQRRPAGCE